MTAKAKKPVIKQRLQSALKLTGNKRVLVFVVAFAFIGTTFLVWGKAASPSVAFEPENSTVTSPAVTGSDAAASGGGYVQFKTASTSGNVGPANCQLTQADEPCWAATTGVKNDFTADANDRWTQSQIVNDTTVSGHKPSEQLGGWLNGCQQITSAMTAGATAANPYVYKNKKIRGYISVQSSYVKIENVYVEYTDSGWCPQGVPGNGAGCCAAVMTGNDDNQTDATKIRNIQLIDSEVEAGYYGANSGIIGPGLNIQRVNAHGGFIIAGYNNRSYMQDVYFHDVTRDDECVYSLANGQSCTGHSGRTYTQGQPDGYLHKDTLWEQGIDNWAIVHSYMKHSSFTNPIGGSSGGCLCNDTVNNVYVSNMFLYGGSSTGIILTSAGHTPTKIVWDNLRLGGGSGPFLGSPKGNAPDYVSTPWTPVWNTTSPGPGPPGIPNITGSHCTNLMNLSGSPISC